MATASDSPSVQPVNSVLDRESPERGGVSSLADTSSFSGISDQKHVLAPEILGSENDGVTKNTVWNNPDNGVAPEVGAVMGAASWPALSKSARDSTKASSTDSLKELSHGSITLSKGSNSGHEPHHPRGPFRRSNSGPQLQGNGSSNHSHGSKRDQERWKHDWSNNHRSLGSRVNLAPQQRVASRPFLRGPVSNAPFIPPPPPVAVQPYGAPVLYNDTSSFMYYAPGPHPSSLGHMPMFPFAPMFYPMTDPHLPSKIVSQIDYYFSDDNLVKDTFLRQKMDVDGWVPINFIANFKKIRELTDNVQLIVDALRASNVVEIQGEKVRRNGNWRKWIMPTIMYPSSPQSLNISSLRIHDEKTDT